MLKGVSLLQRGFTLIELVITLTVMAITLALAAPAYWQWLQNTQVRTATESILVGIKLARAEVLKRNGVRQDPLTGVDVPATELVQLMTSVDASCAPSTSGANWVVSIDPAAGLCDSQTRMRRHSSRDSRPRRRGRATSPLRRPRTPLHSTHWAASRQPPWPTSQLTSRTTPEAIVSLLGKCAA